jgi:hypothetical protein
MLACVVLVLRDEGVIPPWIEGLLGVALLGAVLRAAQEAAGGRNPAAMPNRHPVVVANDRGDAPTELAAEGHRAVRALRGLGAEVPSSATSAPPARTKPVTPQTMVNPPATTA